MSDPKKPGFRVAVRARLQLPWRGLLSLSIAVAGLACIVAGIAWIYPPAGLIATGLALFLALTFDPSSARKVTWPR